MEGGLRSLLPPGPPPSSPETAALALGRGWDGVQGPWPLPYPSCDLFPRDINFVSFLFLILSLAPRGKGIHAPYRECGRTEVRRKKRQSVVSFLMWCLEAPWPGLRLGGARTHGLVWSAGRRALAPVGAPMSVRESRGATGSSDWCLQRV